MAAGLESWARWERTRSKGQQRFVWLWGVCGWGLTCGVAFAVLLLFGLIDGRHPNNPWIAVLPLLMFPAGGYFWGVIMWRWAESSYNAARQKAETHAEQIQAIETLKKEVLELREAIEKRDSNAGA